MTQPPPPEPPDPRVSETPATPSAGDGGAETVVARSEAGGEAVFSQAAREGGAADPSGPPLGRPAPAFVSPVLALSPPPSREEAERPYRAGFLTFLRLFGGWALLLALAYVMWTPGEWPSSVLLWVLLVILADEFGGWFGYLGVLLGGLGYLGPNLPPAQWLIILPLVGGALTALLLVKHSGGAFVLPFAGALFAGTLLAVARYGTKFDPELKLPASETFLRSALLAMGVGLGLSFVRQLVGVFVRRRSARPRPVVPVTPA